ncbi:MAG: hypothetical protein U1E87_11305 [Alphaproteobacteria bacterium]
MAPEISATAIELARRFGDRRGKAAGGRGVGGRIPRHDLHLLERARPLHHRHRDGLLRAGLDAGEHAWMPERRDIALLLQFEAFLIDAAGRINGEHELQIGLALRRRWAEARECDENDGGQ